MKGAITIFACPKPFRGHIGVIQRNAIESWARLRGHCQIILLGDEKGVREVADEFGAQHIAKVGRSEFGTPRVDSIFERAEEIAKNELRMFINSDIVLMNDFLDISHQISFPSFLAIGQRWNLDIQTPIDFEDPGVYSKLRRSVAERGELFSTSGIDYFLYKKIDWGTLPPLAIGRGGMDNWLIYRCRRLGVPVVDLTDTTMVIHQNHDYEHVEGGRKAAYKTGEEALHNRRLAGGLRYYFSIEDANWWMTDKGIERNYCRKKSKRCGEQFHILNEDKPILRSKSMAFAYELWCELIIRLRYLKRGDARYILKYPPWLIYRFAKKR